MWAGDISDLIPLGTSGNHLFLISHMFLDMSVKLSIGRFQCLFVSNQGGVIIAPPWSNPATCSCKHGTISILEGVGLIAHSNWLLLWNAIWHDYGLLMILHEKGALTWYTYYSFGRPVQAWAFSTPLRKYATRSGCHWGALIRFSTLQSPSSPIAKYPLHLGGVRQWFIGGSAQLLRAVTGDWTHNLAQTSQTP